MKILQSDKGDGYIAFSEEEIEYVKKNGCIKFEANSFRKFATHLVKIATEIIERVPNSNNTADCEDGEEIETLK
jgi:hypothetical protein